LSKLIYSAIASLDGYVVDAAGNFEWAAPDEEVHAFVNDLERPIGTYLYGRRMYEVMAFWEADASTHQLAVTRDYAQIWQAADKVVFSSTLRAATTTRTRIQRTFDPAAIARLKETTGHDISIGGPTLAGHALAAGLIDECHLFLTPVVVGSGTPAFPHDQRVSLQLLDERRFASGVVHLHYRTAQ
jgi:dihydrofolate reductase